MEKVLVIGMGKVGTLVGILLSQKFKVTGLDKNKPAYNMALPFEVVQGDVSDLKILQNSLKNFDAVVSCMPYYLNKNIAQTAHDLGIHYFDLTEDVPTTNFIRELAKTSKGLERMSKLFRDREINKVY